MTATEGSKQELSALVVKKEVEEAEEDEDSHIFPMTKKQRTSCSPLQDAIETYIVRMPALVKRQLFAYAQEAHDKYATDGDWTVAVASGCSGTDIGMICAQLVVDHICRKLDIHMGVTHVFSCENDDEKRRFLQSQFHLHRLFADVQNLGRREAFDFISGKMACPPPCTLFMAGFSCKSRSSLSKHAKTNLGCLQNRDASTETSSTFQGVFAYISKTLPATILLENVPGLAQKTSATAMSDAEWVLSELESLGYIARMFQFDAADYGSPASRERIYFAAWLVAPGKDLSKVVDARSRSKLNDILGWMDQLMQCCCIDALLVDEFLDLRAEPRCAVDVVSECTPAQGEGPSAKVWEEEHCDAFRARGMKWPAAIKDVAPNTAFMGKTLSDRQAELLYYIHTVFPFSRSTPIEFCDVNHSMGRLLGPEERSPWKKVAPCLTSKSVICMRYWQKDQVITRPLTGVESLALVGWDSAFYRGGSAGVSESCLRSLAGNAFSAFAVAPMLLVVFSGIGLLKAHSSDLDLILAGLEGLPGGAQTCSAGSAGGSDAESESEAE